MSSGFVSAGTSVPTDAWAAAKAAVEESKQPKAPEPEDERSLFAILQANKVKKQEEFEEKLKFKNQFKPLDEDDVEYLDSILTSERRAEDARRMELETQLDAFRQQQSEVDRGDEQETEAGVGTWAAGRKRRKKDDAGKAGKAGLGVKVRRTSAMAKGETEKVVRDAEVPQRKKEVEVEVEVKVKVKVQDKKDKKEVPKAPVVPAAGLLGLVAYGSDDDD